MLKPKLLAQLSIFQNLPSGVENSQASRFSPTSNALLSHVLSSCDGCGIDITVAIETLISILHDRHLLLASSQIRARHIHMSSNGLLLGQSNNEIAGQLLKLFGRQKLGINLDATLG